jgi:hypothetical protein
MEGIIWGLYDTSRNEYVDITGSKGIADSIVDINRRLGIC